jgi:hypothetical protein
MVYNDLPEKWKVKIAEYLKQKGIEDRIVLNATDFNTNEKTTLKFEDGSKAEFQYSFFIKAPEWNEIGVFTEHCGYHIFNLSAVEEII